MWVPIRCILSLDFAGTGAAASSRGGGDGRGRRIATGATYTGVSTIQYAWRAGEGPGPGPPAALHFHATTTTPAPSRGAAETRGSPAPAAGGTALFTPLVIESMKLTCPSRGGGPLRITRVLEDDAVATTGPGARHGKTPPEAKAVARRGGGTAKGAEALAPPPAAAEGSKHVLFECSGGGALEVEEGLIVELAVHFTGTIHTQAHGGFYAYPPPPERSSAAPRGTAATGGTRSGHGGGGPAAKAKPAGSTTAAEADGGAARAGPHAERHLLLSHFEVSLARRAFPCPDDPAQYRLYWNLSSVVVPSAYTFAASNGALLDSPDRPSARAGGGATATYRFAEVGPLPAYAIAVAAIAGGVDVVDGELPPFAAGPPRRGAATTAPGGVAGHPAWSRDAVPLRVLSSPLSGLSRAALAVVAEGVAEAVRLLEEAWRAPLPLTSFAGVRPDGGAEPEERSRGGGRHAFVVAVAPSLAATSSLAYASLVPAPKLDVFVGPTPPFIAGMEHHGCIFLNHDLLRPHAAFLAPNHTTVAGLRRHAPAAALATLASLLVHEVAHHWFGNAIGVSFEMKEGICQVMEYVYGDVLLGKPPRPLRATAGSTAAAAAVVVGVEERSATGPPPPLPPGAPSPSHASRTVTPGKEFTFLSYQNALDTINGLAMRVGMEVFQERLARLVRRSLRPVTHHDGLLYLPTNHLVRALLDD